MSELFDLSGRTVLLTGGANGLGRMMAEALLGAGAEVYITSRRDAETAAGDLKTLGTCHGINADLSSPEGAVALAEAIRERTDSLNVLINNAGATFGAPLESFPDKAWDKVMAINLQSPFTLVRELVGHLEKAGTPTDPARILNVGSIAGSGAQRLSAYSYTASKAAIHHLTRELAADLARRNIAANVIVPGWFPTDMTAHVRADDSMSKAVTRKIPLGRYGEPDDIGGVTVFLASRAAAYITGAEIPVEGGLIGCR